MRFENLANELLLTVFDYLSAIDLLRTFTNLNEHFDQLLQIHFQSSSALDCRSISLNDYHILLKQYLPQYAVDFRSIRLSNDDDTPQAIDLFFQHGFTFDRFHNLKNLSICDLCSESLMNSILNQWSSLNNLTHFTLAGSYFYSHSLDQQRLIDAIWNLPNLIDCYLHVIFFNNEDSFPLPTVNSLSMKSLSLWGNSYCSQTIHHLLMRTPQLERCSFIANMEISSPIVLTEKFFSLKHLTLITYHLDEEMIGNILLTMPNLKSLKIDYDSSSTDSSTIFDGYQWERLIRCFLPLLDKFHLGMRFQSSTPLIHQLMDTFRSPFWIDEHQWYIRCHWNPFDTSSFVYLHTRSFAWHTYNNRSNLLIDSTDPHEIQPFLFPSMSSFHLIIESSLGPDLRSTGFKFDMITNLTVSLDNFTLNQTELQFVFKQCSHLRTLSLQNGIINEKLFSILALTIKQQLGQLNLRLIDGYFDAQQCQILSRSSLAQQCQSLLIKIQTSTNLLELLQSMPHLHALNIECEKCDHVLDWCRLHLPSTCLITQGSLFPNDIHIWIHHENKY